MDLGSNNRMINSQLKKISVSNNEELNSEEVNNEYYNTLENHTNMQNPSTGNSSRRKRQGILSFTSFAFVSPAENFLIIKVIIILKTGLIRLIWL